MCSKHEHRCIYRFGWLTSSWCGSCKLDWAAFERFCCPAGQPEVVSRSEYEAQTETECGPPLNIEPPAPPPPAPLVGQLLLPWAAVEPGPEEVAEALARRFAGCAWSLQQLAPSEN